MSYMFKFKIWKWDRYVMLSFVCLTFIPRTAVMVACSYAIILEEAIYYFDTVHIRTKLETIAGKQLTDNP